MGEWGLIDVTQLPVAELISSDGSVLANAVRRVVVELDQAQEVLSAFDNYAGGPDDDPTAQP